ncbi:MAG TPA: hypothetical protein VMD59_17925, partial [Acidimicrobiales bacterium]|nr:hypothetical protein [Acidimicrobiales bacterium]
YVVTWRRSAQAGGAERNPDADAAVILPLLHLAGRGATARLLYPGLDGARIAWHDGPGELTVELARAPSACLVELSAPPR